MFVTENIYQRLAPVFENVFDEDDIQLAPETTANDIDDWDSLRHIRLIIALEQEFSISFKTSEVNDFKNVGELVDMIQSKLAD